MTGYSPGSEVLTTLNRLSVTRSWNFGSTWANGDFSRKCSTQKVICHYWPISQNQNPGESSRSYCGGWWIRHPIWRTELDVSTAHRSRAWSSFYTTVEEGKCSRSGIYVLQTERKKKYLFHQAWNPVSVRDMIGCVWRQFLSRYRVWNTVEHNREHLLSDLSCFILCNLETSVDIY